MSRWLTHGLYQCQTTGGQASSGLSSKPTDCRRAKEATSFYATLLLLRFDPEVGTGDSLQPVERCAPVAPVLPPGWSGESICFHRGSSTAQQLYSGGYAQDDQMLGAASNRGFDGADISSVARLSYGD